MTNTCKHLHDNGDHRNSSAAKDRDYCVYHLRYRARRLRVAQARARSERSDLKRWPRPFIPRWSPQRTSVVTGFHNFVLRQQASAR